MSLKSKLTLQNTNIIAKNTEDDVKTKDGAALDNVHNRYIDYKYRDLINDIFTNGLKDGDLHLTNFDNRIDLNNIVNRYLKEKYIDVYDRYFNSKNSIKILADINNMINILIAEAKPDKEIGLEEQKKSC